MRKSYKELSYIPQSIGLMVGVGDGLIAQKITTPHARSYYRAGVAGLGFVGERSLGWNSDISMAMMTAAATMAAQAIPRIVAGGGNALPYAAPAAYPGVLRTDIPETQKPTRAGWATANLNPMASGKRATQSATIAG